MPIKRERTCEPLPYLYFKKTINNYEKNQILSVCFIRTCTFSSLQQQ